MAEIINGVPIGDLPGIESVPDDSMLVVEFLGKAYSMPGAVLRQMIQDVLDSMGDSVDDVTEARLTTAIETVLSSGKYSGVSPIVEVTKQEDETFVLHVVDAFGIKDYPIKVKVPDLSNGGNVMVALSGDSTNGYSVTMDGEAVTGDTLDKMAKEGSSIIGVVSSSLGFTLPNGFPNYVQEGTIFQYGNAVASRDPETFENPVGHKFEFHMRVNDVDYGLFYEEEQWKGVAVSAFLTLLLTEDDGAPYFSYNGQLLNSWYLSEILYMASITNRPVFCYQKDMRFYTEDGAAIIPQQYTAFTLTLTAAGDYVFSCEQDGYKYTLEVSGWGEYAPTAEKTIAYRTAESKADDLKAEDGTLFLLSAGEPIGAGVSIPTGDNNVFIGNYDTVTFSAIKIAHRTGKVCFLNNEGLMLPLLSLSDTEAIFVREINENTDYRVTITADGGKSFTMQDKNISDVYVSGLFSAKYAEAKAAYEAGKACFITYGALLCPLTVLDEEKAEFVGMLTPNMGIKGIVPAEGTIDWTYVRSNAVQTVEQSLSDDQKAQARTNIGALSAGDVDAVLQQAKDSGQFDGKDGEDGQDGKDGYTPVKGKDYFDGYTPVKGKDYFDGANGKTAYAYAQDGGYTGTEAEFAAKLASDSEPLVVTLSGNDTDGYTADKTVAEIYAARTAGRDVYMVGGVVTYQLSYLNSSFAAFSYTMASRNAIEIISVIMMSGVAPTRIHQTIDDSYVKYTAQSLDEEYKLQARTNIGAAAAADIATTKYASTSTANTSYFKISDFGSWGTGAWYQKGFSMLITSRAGETVWFSLSANDSATTARAFRLMNTYSKIAGVYYSVSENAVYVKANAWCNNVTAHILSNIGGDYVPTVASVSGLASDAVEVDIIEFGPTSSGLAVGDSSTPLLLGGSATRPTYNGADMALSSDLSSYVTTDTAQTITGVKTFNAPANVASTEQHTAKFKTSNGGSITFGKEGPNSGTMIRLDQTDGTCRLRFRASDTAGAMVWEQPEQGAQLYVDLGKEGVDKKRIIFPSSAGTLALTSQIPSLSGYLPLSGGLMTGPLKFQAASLPGKSLQYICGIDAFASGGEMGWQSKAEFLSGYLTTTGTAARATADANGNNIANTYAKVTTANDYDGEQRFKNSAYCPTITDTASGIGCAFKSSRGLVNELLADKIIATASTGKIPFYSYTGASNGSMTGLTEFAYLSPGAFILRPPSGEGGQIQLEAAANDPTNTGICIDTAGGNFRIFGLQSADGVTTTGYGSVLAIHPYAKVITGGYSFDGIAAKATADGNGRNIVSTYATKDEVVTAANGSFKVTLSGNDTDGYTVDKTLAQIETALNAGRHVYLVGGVNVYQLSYHLNDFAAAFTSVMIPSPNAQVSIRTVLVFDGMAPSVFTKTI